MLKVCDFLTLTLVCVTERFLCVQADADVSRMSRRRVRAGTGALVVTASTGSRTLRPGRPAWPRPLHWNTTLLLHYSINRTRVTYFKGYKALSDLGTAECCSPDTRPALRCRRTACSCHPVWRRSACVCGSLWSTLWNTQTTFPMTTRRLLALVSQVDPFSTDPQLDLYKYKSVHLVGLHNMD